MIAVAFREPTGTSALEVLEFPEPAVGAGEVLIAVVAASVNWADFGVVGGTFGSERLAALAPPYIPGWDLAGTVEAVGNGVDSELLGRLVLGFEQWGATGHGTQASRVVLPVEQIAVTSRAFEPTELTMLGLNGMTALQLVAEGRVEAGQTVLVTGAAGSVGSFAVSIAADRGASVIALAAEKDRDYVLSRGATRFVSYTLAPGSEWPSGIDVVLNTVPGAAIAVDAVANGGIYRSITGMPESTDGIDIARVRVRPDPDDLRTVVTLAERDVLDLRTPRVFPAVKAGEAYEAFAAGARRVVLTF